MKFLVDECADIQLVEFLRAHDHDVSMSKTTRLRELLQNATIALVGAFVVVESDKLRVRPLIV